MSLSNNYPTIRPTLEFDFANVGALDPRITFTRATSATFVNQLGVIQTAASGIPRFDYDPSTLAARGLLIEEQRTNLLTYSEQFDNAAWTKSNATVTANAATSPDGTVNADTLVENTANNSHFIYQNNTVSGANTSSVYAKAAGRNFLLMRYYIGTDNWVSAVFNLSTGVVSQTNAGVSSTFTGFAASIQALNNGWYRCILTATGTSIINLLIGLCNTATPTPQTDGTVNYIGDGVSGVHLWGAQLEAGSFATSYIPTVASTVTRNTDLASVNTLSPWYSSECTIYCEASVLPGNVNSSTKMLFGGGPTGNSPALIEYGGVLQLLIQGVGFPLAAATGLTVATKKVAGRFKNGSFGLAVDGVVTSSTNAQTAGSGSAFGIGSVPIPSDYLNGHVRRVAFYPRALTNAELQALTA